MSNFVKVDYHSGVTKITAQNLNDIQDELIRVCTIVDNGSNNNGTITNLDAKNVTLTTPSGMQSKNVQSAIEELSSNAVKTVNGEAIANNNIEISLNKTNDNITFSAANKIYGTLEFMTTQEVQAIKNLFN